MYQIFTLPHDFLNRQYTPDETQKWDEAMHDAAFQSVDEELDDKQKKRVDNWAPMDYRVRTLHDSVFGEGNERIEIPYDTGDDKPLDHDAIMGLTYNSHGRVAKQVATILHSKGYRVHDYVAGLAHEVDNPNRKMKIGKIIEKHGIGDTPVSTFNPKRSDGNTSTTLAKAFANDPVRAAFKSDKKIIITRNRHDVAGMSTDRGWTSCMHMEEGCNRHYLPNDLREGTLTAYLAKVDDNGLKSPIGRINLKRFINGGHDIFRPESNVYGTVPHGGGFAKQVQDWATKNYESKPGMYAKAANLYNDDGKAIKMEKLPDHKDMKNFHGQIYQVVAAQKNKAEEHLDQVREKDPYEYEDAQYHHKNQLLNMVKSAYRQLPDKHYAGSVVHHLVDHARDYDGDTNDDDHDAFENHFIGGDLHTDHIMHEFARKHDTARLRAGIKDMTPDEAFEHHVNIHKAIHNTAYPENHQELKDVHRKLVSHIMEHGTDQHRDAIASDALDGEHDYYDEVTNGHDLVKMTTNPRLHQRIIEKHPDKHDDFRADTFTHMGKHADLKSAHSFMHNPDMGEHLDLFVKGLNENPNGEHIQHKLTEEMYLPGETNTNSHPLKSIMSPSHLQMATTDGGVHHRDKTDYSSVHKDKFGSIIANTRFKSVLDKLSNRQDTKDHPDFNNVFEQNGYKYVQEQKKVPSFKGFLASGR